MEKTFEVGKTYLDHTFSCIELCDAWESDVYLTVVRKTDKSIWFDKAYKSTREMGEPVVRDIVHVGIICYRYHTDKSGNEVATHKRHYIFREFVKEL